MRLPGGGIYLAFADGVGDAIWAYMYEEEERLFLRKFLKYGMVFVDIGAHHGLYTILASRCVGSQGLVIAFEPSPREFSRLKLHCRLNRCRNVVLEQCAVGERTGTVIFYVEVHGTALSSIKPAPDVGKCVPIQTAMVTLDDYINQKKIQKVDVIKVDVEGSELAVLKGAVNVLSVLRPIVLSELLDQRTLPYGYLSRDIYQFLHAYNYVLFSFIYGGKLRYCPYKANYAENLLAVPKEKLDQVKQFIVE